MVKLKNPFILYFDLQNSVGGVKTFNETFEVSEILLNGFCSIDDRGIAAKDEFTIDLDF